MAPLEQTTSRCVGLTLAELSVWLSADASDVGGPVIGARLMTSSGVRLIASLGEAARRAYLHWVALGIVGRGRNLL